MEYLLPLVLIALLDVTLTATIDFEPSKYNIRITTADRIANFGYPVETHEVVTSDGYILTMFRIPYSPKQQNSSVIGANKPRPVFFLGHGMVTSSDYYILNGSENSLPFLLADAGYDVWLGNNRGNTYSRSNIYQSPNESLFWEFTVHEMGTTDMPAMIDFILELTDQEKLHYVGHSQGATVIFILLSEKPEYNTKFKTLYLMAPVAFLGNSKSQFWLNAAAILKFAPILGRWLEGLEFLPFMQSFAQTMSKVCSWSWMDEICTEMLYITCGWDTEHFNYTLLPQVYECLPAGTSTNQLFHYLQLMNSKTFQQCDHGPSKNFEIYGQSTPPDYNLSNIRAPIRLYSAENDLMATEIDVKLLEEQLPNIVENYVVPVKIWNHADFIFAIDVKEYVYNRIIRTANFYELTGKQWK